MKQIELIIANATGLHARPAKVLVTLAKRFKSTISLQVGTKKVNGKSLVSVLTLGAVRGSQVAIEAAGEDEDAAVAEIEAAFRAGLGEGETAAPSPAHDQPVGSTAPPPAPDRESSWAGALVGIPAAPGIAVGPVFVYEPTEPDSDLSGHQAGRARLSLGEALSGAQAQLGALSARLVERNLAAQAAIFEAHSELLEDPELAEAVQARVDHGENLPRAWRTSVDERAAAIAALPDPLLAARADDLRDAGRRVLRLLLGLADTPVSLPDHPVVIVARDLGPSDAANFDPQRVLGFALVNGGPSAHIAILARAMGLPAVVGAVADILTLPPGTPVVLNGTDGTLTPNPSAAALERAAQAQQRWLEKRRAALADSALPALTQDGRRIEITANAGSVADAAEALRQGADGIGLLRTEFLFLERTTAPSEDEQYAQYHAIAETMGTRPVIVRTLDIGGDKPVPYIHLNAELNPFLGERGIRLCLNRLDLFRAQLRAILRAAPVGNLKIMFPMVADVSELRQARALVEELRLALNAPPISLGIMIEVPSAALLADKLAPEVDFFSIGTNDLTQYTLAVDRGHPVLAAKHDGLHPAVLRLIAQTVAAAHRYGKRADLCGELGSDPEAIPILVGLELDELSVSLPSVPLVKAQIRALSLKHCQQLARQALDCASALAVRSLVRQAPV